MEIYIKCMVSLRCKMAVAATLKKLGLAYSSLDLGIVMLTENITAQQRHALKKQLFKSGLVLLDDKRNRLIEKITALIIEMTHDTDDLSRIMYYLRAKSGHDCTYLSNLFSEVKGITLQQFIILHKIERVKELLLYNELNLTKIAAKLHYSSVAHLSNQFKKVTGHSPSFYRKLNQKRRENTETG